LIIWLRAACGPVQESTRGSGISRGCHGSSTPIRRSRGTTQRCWRQWEFSHYDLVRWLLARGGNVNARADARSRQTLLHSAAWNGDLEMVRLLVEAGADPNARDEQYNGTPLGWAKTSIDVTNNAKCDAVAAYLERLTQA
jgi:hypothetical protein